MRIIFILCSLCFLLTGCVNSEEAPAIKPEKPFYFGVYTYDYALKELAEEQGKTIEDVLDEHMGILHEKGVNAMYLAVSRPDSFGKYLELSKKHDIKLIPQLEFGYFRQNCKDMDKRARKTGEFIKKYQESPQVIAWSVREEIPHNQINELAKYYMQILEYAPDARFNIVHSGIGAAKDQPVPDPYILGTDRYAFWWEVSAGGYLASPSFALQWTRSQFGEYQEEAAKRGADFMAVVTQGGLALPKSAQKVCANTKEMTYPNTDVEKEKLHKKALKFAEEGRMGWKQFETPEGVRYNFWKYYRTPENCMKALAWSSVMQGARLFFCWSYNPRSKKFLEFDFKTSTSDQFKRTEFGYWTLAGRPGKPNPQLDEFADASREIRKYERIITSMSKIPDASPLNFKGKNFHSRAFNFPGIKGKIIVLHNANVGTWPGESRRFFREDDPIYIDDEANLLGYNAFKEAMPAQFEMGKEYEGKKLYDILTGKEIQNLNGVYEVPVLPGSGTLLFAGDEKEAAELTRICNTPKAK